MNKKHRDFSKTPSEFYRTIRPEFFSDSELFYEIKLPEEHFAYELSQISTNQKQDAFETLGRRLAEKFISPNLIPQVGPTGGGDGKTDSETYPVSEITSDRWFTPENGWSKNENWAFAISAKEDWKSKVKLDVQKIIGTGRSYTKIYFISNQKIRSKDRKATQDEFKQTFKKEVIILDGEWITRKIYDNDLINIAVDSLNLSDVYKSKKVKIGENDALRIKKLEEIEENINNPSRYFEYDYQLVEDALESAILSRMLEKPKEEVIGKFDRALKLAEKVKNTNQLIRIHYQRAWTFINWYDEYSYFISEFLLLKEYVENEININSIELYYNLLNVLRGILYNAEIRTAINNVDYEIEEKDFISILDICISNRSKPATGLVANTQKSFLNIFRFIQNDDDVSNELKILNKHFQDSRSLLEYPFESFKKMVEVFGELLPNNKEYDTLIDSIAEISESRASELASGETFLKRGFQKLSKEYYKESLIYFGKSVRKLAKEESEDYLYSALMGLNQAYANLGLLWASNNCIIAATSITIKQLYNEGKLHKKLYNCISEALKTESFLGRIPYILSWYELLKVVSFQLENEQIEEDQIPTLELVDACLSIRLLNSNFKTWSDFSDLPDLFEKETLWLSQDATLFMLGHTELIDQGFLKKLNHLKTLDEYFNMIANQPFKEQIVYDTNLLNTDLIEFKSVILGTEFRVSFNKNKGLVFFAETLLAFLESFLATSFEEVFPTSEKIMISLYDGKEGNLCEIKEITNNAYEIHINSQSNENEKLGEQLIQLTANIVGRNFVFKEPTEYLENLYKHDEVHERQSIVTEHRKFSTNIFGENAKFFIDDWRKDFHKIYEFKRDYNPIRITNEKSKKSNTEIHNIKHSQTKVSSIIDNYLWDNAQWKGFGFFISPETPFGIFIAFKNESYGKQIFENWIKRFGQIDKDEEINISIIRGVNKDNPFWYKVHINKSMGQDILKEGNFVMSSSRFHEMTAENPTNLTNLISGFHHFRQYTLMPASYSSDGKIVPYIELGITKKKLTVREAWEIGENDLDNVVIRLGDKPIIPKDKPDAPVIGLIKKKRQ